MQGAERYWNPVLETLPPDRLREFQFRKFKRIVSWAYERSPFYRSVYDQAGFRPDMLRTFGDIRSVPKVEKSLLRGAQEHKEPEPYGDLLAVPPARVTTFRQTSGTTGRPVYQGDTWQDWDWWQEAWSYLLYAQGYRDTDKVFFPFGYNIFVAFWAAHYAAEKMGCETIPGGVLGTEARLEKMREVGATAFLATPTYVLGMADAARKMGLDPRRDLSIRRITCAGEPGASIPATKKRMEEAFGADVYDHCGATEIGAWGFECDAKPGGIHVNEGLFLAEIEDLDTGEIVEEPGRRGRLIITALDRVGMPCVRFDSKDVVEWAEEPCECGRTFRVFRGGVLGRADDIVKVKGVLLAPSVIEEVVRSFSELSDEYEVTVFKQGDLDCIELKVEPAPASGAQGALPDLDHSRMEEVIGRLSHDLRVKTNLGYQIEAVEAGSLPRYTLKAQRFKDLRKEVG